MPPIHWLLARHLNWAASGVSDREVRASNNALTLTPLSTGVAVVVIFCSLIVCPVVRDFLIDD